MVYRETRDNTEFIIADSVSELAAAVADGTANHPAPFELSFDREHFFGRTFADFDEVRRATTEKWDEGLAVVERMLDDLKAVSLPQPRSRRRRTRFSEDNGDEVDFDRLRDGRPFWRTSRRENSKGPGTITIIANMDAACTVSPQDVLWRGAAAVALTHLLESAGYRVELWTVNPSREAWQDKTQIFAAARVKAHGEPLDMGACIAAVSAWFLRTVGFASANIVQQRKPTAFAGKTWPGALQRFGEILGKRDRRVLVDGVWSHRQAVEFIRETLESLNVL